MNKTGPTWQALPVLSHSMLPSKRNLMQGHCFQMDIIHIQTKNKKVATSAAVQKSRLKKNYGNGMGPQDYKRSLVYMSFFIIQL